MLRDSGRVHRHRPFVAVRRRGSDRGRVWIRPAHNGGQASRCDGSSARLERAPPSDGPDQSHHAKNPVAAALVGGASNVFSLVPTDKRSECFVTRTTNPDHLVPSTPSPTNVPPLRIAARYAAGRPRPNGRQPGRLTSHPFRGLSPNPQPAPPDGAHSVSTKKDSS